MISQGDLMPVLPYAVFLISDAVIARPAGVPDCTLIIISTLLNQRWIRFGSIQVYLNGAFNNGHYHV